MPSSHTAREAECHCVGSYQGEDVEGGHSCCSGWIGPDGKQSAQLIPRAVQLAVAPANAAARRYDVTKSAQPNSWKAKIGAI